MLSFCQRGYNNRELYLILFPRATLSYLVNLYQSQQLYGIFIILYQMPEISPTFRATIIGLMILSGAINTLAYKFQNKQYVYEGPYHKYFFHPYMQATTMFFGQMLALFAFIFLKKRNPQKYEAERQEAEAKGKNVNINKFLFAIPALCDFFSSILHYIALNFISGSVYLMMRGGTIITTFLFSVIFLKIRIQRHQIVGSSLALLGVVIVGASNMLFSNSSSGSSTPGLQIVGYILVLISLFFNGFFFVFEQKLFHNYHLNALEVVGYEGVFGLCAFLVVLPILNFIPCTLGVDACVFTYEGYAFIERPGEYFAQAFSSGSLLFFCILGVFSIATFNITGVTVTKYINALARSIAEVTRTIVVWTVGIIVTVSAGSVYPNYKWELLNGGAIVVELVGFLALVSGNLIYNKMIKLPAVLQDEQDQNLVPLQQEH